MFNKNFFVKFLGGLVAFAVALVAVPALFKVTGVSVSSDLLFLIDLAIAGSLAFFIKEK